MVDSKENYHVRVMSDLHLEFHRDAGAEFIRNLRLLPTDVLVLAGDICAGWMLPSTMTAFCSRTRAVVLVIGNHEFYRSDRPSVIKFAEKACKGNKNLHWLDCGSYELDGVVFHGTPLWFKEAPLAPKHHMNDWNLIQGFDDWVYEENRRAIRFLTENVQKGDVVVTHYLPSEQSVSPQFKGNPLNPFFLCDVEGLIRDREPSVLIHGHTHSSLDYQIGPTRVICNPKGYGNENYRDFDPGKVVTIERDFRQTAT